MKKVLTLLLTLILSILSLGFASCGEADGGDNSLDKKYDTSKDQPYVIATVFPQEGRNAYTGIVRQVGGIGNKPFIQVETPKLEGWYLTFSSDNEKMLTVDENGRCEVFRSGTVYVTVTYTNGVDKVTDIVSWYNTHWNRDIDVFFRAEGLDPAGDYMATQWSLSLNNPVTLTPLLIYSAGMFDDCEILSVTSSDESVVVFEDGKLVPLKAGTSEIVIDCTWRGFIYSSYKGDTTYGGTGSADLRRTITVTVS